MRYQRFWQILMLLMLVNLNVQAQEIYSLRIIPAEPTSADSITVISDFSYAGACAFGLVYEYIYTTDTSIHIAPTYCGYFSPDSVLCQSIDTFRIPPLAAGTYRLNITYHQGSICPVSDFDAVIATFDTSLAVSGTQASHDVEKDVRASVRVYPNPATDVMTILIDPSAKPDAHQFVLVNTLGQVVLRDEIDLPVTYINILDFNGIFYLKILNTGEKAIGVFKVLFQ